MIGKEEAKILEERSSLSDRFAIKTRLNLNELLKRKSDEKKVDKRANLIIFSSVSAVALVVLLILNL